VLSKKAWEEFEKYADKQAAEQQKKMLALMMPSKEQMKEWEEGFAAQERIEDIGVQARRDELRRRASRSARMAELTAGQETPMAMSEAEKRELSRERKSQRRSKPTRSGSIWPSSWRGSKRNGYRKKRTRPSAPSWRRRRRRSVHGNSPSARPA